MSDRKPRTEAGKRLLARYTTPGQWQPQPGVAEILAIEAEAAPPPLDGLREALRDFMALLPPERWALLRPATQATIDALAQQEADHEGRTNVSGPRIGAGKRLWAESLIRGRNER